MDIRKDNEASNTAAAHTAEDYETKISGNENRTNSSRTSTTRTGMENIPAMETARRGSRILDDTPGVSISQQVHSDRRSDFGGHSVHAPKAVDTRNKELATRPGILLQAEASEESFREMEIHSSLRGDKQVYDKEAFQSRRPSHAQTNLRARNVHGPARHRGRLLQQTAEAAPELQKILQIRSEDGRPDTSVRVSGYASGMDYEPPSAAYTVQAGDKGSEPPGYIPRASDGRRVDRERFGEKMRQAADPDGRDNETSRLQLQNREEKVTQQDSSLVWSEDRNVSLREVFSHHRKGEIDKTNGEMDIKDGRRKTTDTPNGSGIHRKSEISYNVPGMRHGTHVQLGERADRSPLEYGAAVGRTFSAEDDAQARSSILPYQSNLSWEIHGDQLNRDSLSDRCFELRVWGKDLENPRELETAHPENGAGFLDRSRIEDAYKRERTRRLLPSGAGMSQPRKRIRQEAATDGISPEYHHRQSSVQVLSQQARRTLPDFEPNDDGVPTMGQRDFPTFRVGHDVNVSGRRSDDTSGRRRTLSHGPSRRRNHAESEDVQIFMQTPEIRPSDRSVRHALQHPTSSVLQPLSRSESKRHQCDGAGVAPAKLCFSPHQDDTKLLTENSNEQRGGLNHIAANTVSHVVPETAEDAGITTDSLVSRKKNFPLSQRVPKAEKAMVTMELDWSDFVVKQLSYHKGLEKKDAEKVAATIWSNNTRPSYKTKWKDFFHWYEREFGEEPTEKSIFVKRAQQWMMEELQRAIEGKNTFYEQVSDRISAVSGTIQHTLGIRPGEDPTIQRLRDKAKIHLRRRTDDRKENTAVDVPALLKLIDQDAKEDDITTKVLRAKLISLMIIDTGARPQTIRNCTRLHTRVRKKDGLRVLECLPLSTKDQHLAKDKTPRVLQITEFPFNRNLCTVHTYLQYMNAIQRWNIKDDIQVATVSDGKPERATTTSIFVKFTEPHESLSEKTVRSECRKYLDRLQSGTGPKELRKSVPSIIQAIDEEDDERTAKRFKWQRDSTFKKWYKSAIPPKLREKITEIDKEFPDSWKLRHDFIPKNIIIEKFKEKYKLSGTLTDYFKQK